MSNSGIHIRSGLSALARRVNHMHNFILYVKRNKDGLCCKCCVPTELATGRGGIAAISCGDKCCRETGVRSVVVLSVKRRFHIVSNSTKHIIDRNVLVTVKGKTGRKTRRVHMAREVLCSRCLSRSRAVKSTQFCGDGAEKLRKIYDILGGTFFDEDLDYETRECFRI